MSAEKLREKVAISEEGAIFLGKYVACDGFAVDRPIAIMSHAHGDHVKQFESALSLCPAVIMTEETKRLLVADRGEWLLRRTNLKELAFGQTYCHENNQITLYPVTHMLGSCQVLLVNGDGTRIVYTGDFNYPHTKPVKADVLVMEATYGLPTAVRTLDNDSLTEKVVSIVKKGIEDNTPVRIIAHPGKIQCLMSKLASANLKAPFLAHIKDVNWAEVYRHHGSNVGTVYASGGKEAYEIQKTGKPYVSFHRIGSNIPESENHLTIRTSAYGVDRDIEEPRKNYFRVALSDHADFSGLLEYVKGSQPKLVITDASRCKDRAPALAEEIKNRLGIEAMALPI